MYSHNSANVTGEVPPASCDCEIFGRIESIGIDHEIAIVLVDARRFAAIPTVEEFGDALHLCLMYCIHIKPGTIARNDHGKALRR